MSTDPVSGFTQPVKLNRGSSRSTDLRSHALTSGEGVMPVSTSRCAISPINSTE